MAFRTSSVVLQVVMRSANPGAVVQFVLRVTGRHCPMNTIGRLSAGTNVACGQCTDGGLRRAKGEARYVSRPSVSSAY